MCFRDKVGGAHQERIPSRPSPTLARPTGNLTFHLSNPGHPIPRGSTSDLDSWALLQLCATGGAPRMRTSLSWASSCHLRKIKILPPGDKACCARDRYDSDSQPVAINPEKNVTHLPERLRCSRLPTGSGLSQSLEGFLRRENPAAEPMCFPAVGCAVPQVRTLAHSIPAQNTKG